MAISVKPMDDGKSKPSVLKYEIINVSIIDFLHSLALFHNMDSMTEWIVNV